MIEPEALQQMDPETQKNVSAWLNGDYDQKTKEEIERLLKENPQEVVDAFYKTLAFGTGGMRGIMGVGTNRMNVYTIRAATQGLANYILQQTPGEEGHAVIIGYDSRHHSKEFAEEAAKVLAANSIQVYLFRDLRPTPLVSYGCRFKKCISGIMITASHNPPQYNGYKVYWSDGGQVLPPHDVGIINEVQKITDLNQIKHLDTLDSPLIQLIEEDVDDAYLESVFTLQFYPQENKAQGPQLKVVYTSLYGTGITLTPRILRMWGFTDISFVDSQIRPNGDFPTAPYPNPEVRQALEEGIKVLKATDADLLIANDPDADRVGVVAKHHGQEVILTGNQVACIAVEHICEALKNLGQLSSKTAFVKSVVTTELFCKIVQSFGASCFDVLTGFKYIAEKIHAWETEGGKFQYIFGAEESYGYLLGTFSRDKDAVLASALICEIALKAKLQGKTLVDLLNDLFLKYGIFANKVLSINFEESKEGQAEMKQAMETLRQSPLATIADQQVIAIDDYLSLKKHNLETGDTTDLTLPHSDMLIYWLKSGSKVMVRPSGTEPKVKIYCEVLLTGFGNLEEGEKEADKQADALLQAMQTLLKKTP